VFKTSGKPKKPHDQDALESSQSSAGDNNKHLKKASKDVSLAKKSKIDKLIDKDLERGPQFRRQEIETMMTDKNFANMYAEPQKYRSLELGSQLQIKRQMEVLKDELFAFD